MPNIHLITSCSKSKNGRILDTIFPRDVVNIDEAYKQWSAMLKSRFSKGVDVVETETLYRGTHWNTALNIKENRTDISLWVISAGMGLRHSSDPAVPYEATFSSMMHNSASFWELLIKDPILPGHTSSLKALLSLNNADKFVIAVSPVYLRAVEHDLLQGITYLHKPKEQIIIATSKGYGGLLSPYIQVGSKSMMALLNSNMTTLNIKHAAKIISRI
ncbi:hypothetical protein [Serratia fonticola]